jgi:hypothetical protein
LVFILADGGTQYSDKSYLSLRRTFRWVHHSTLWHSRTRTHLSRTHLIPLLHNE